MNKSEFTMLLWNKIAEWDESEAGPIVSQNLGDDIDDFIDEYVQERLLALHEKQLRKLEKKIAELKEYKHMYEQLEK